MRRPCFTAGLPKLCTEVVLQSRTLHRIVVVSVAVPVLVWSVWLLMTGGMLPLTRWASGHNAHRKGEIR